jgi:hypothetical protein
LQLDPITFMLSSEGDRTNCFAPGTQVAGLHVPLTLGEAGMLSSTGPFAVISDGSGLLGMDSLDGSLLDCRQSTGGHGPLGKAVWRSSRKGRRQTGKVYTRELRAPAGVGSAEHSEFAFSRVDVFFRLNLELKAIGEVKSTVGPAGYVCDKQLELVVGVLPRSMVTGHHESIRVDSASVMVYSTKR